MAQNATEKAKAEALVVVSAKIASWFERQAARNEDKAKTERFVTLKDAYIKDAKNYRAMARDLRVALAPWPKGTDDAE